MDYHTYDDSPSIPAADSLGVNVPVVIGECGQSSSLWDDDVQYSAVRECFAQAETGGYMAALSWYYNYAGSENPYTHLNPDGTWRRVGDAFEEFSSSELTTGINLAWLTGAYDHDFGLNPLHPSWGIAYSNALASAVVTDIANAGIPLVRMWLFEGQEALYFHSVFDDFEKDTAGWTSLGDGTTIQRSELHASDGDSSLQIHIETDTPDWYGITKPWMEDTRLNLTPSTQWSYVVHSDLNQAVGVNLGFVTEVEAVSTTYQTLPGPNGGELWLNPGETYEKVVSLSPEDFEEQWALETDPSTGVPRPPDEEMENVSGLRLRVYLASGQLPASGELYIDAIRIK
jgi:hypothetical protein